MNEKYTIHEEGNVDARRYSSEIQRLRSILFPRGRFSPYSTDAQHLRNSSSANVHSIYFFPLFSFYSREYLDRHTVVSTRNTKLNRFHFFSHIILHLQCKIVRYVLFIFIYSLNDTQIHDFVQIQFVRVN